jgi:hypothetical protein
MSLSIQIPELAERNTTQRDFVNLSKYWNRESDYGHQAETAGRH